MQLILVCATMEKASRSRDARGSYSAQRSGFFRLSRCMSRPTLLAYYYLLDRRFGEAASKWLPDSRVAIKLCLIDLVSISIDLPITHLPTRALRLQIEALMCSQPALVLAPFDHVHRVYHNGLLIVSFSRNGKARLLTQVHEPRPLSVHHKPIQSVSTLDKTRRLQEYRSTC